jgi:hypothetical protein
MQYDASNRSNLGILLTKAISTNLFLTFLFISMHLMSLNKFSDYI